MIKKSQKIMKYSFLNIIFFILTSLGILMGVNYMDISDRIEKLESISKHFEDMDIIIANQDKLDYKIYNEGDILPDGLSFRTDDCVLYLNYDVLHKLDDGRMLMMYKSDILVYSAIIYTIMVMLLFHFYTRYVVGTISEDNEKSDLIKLQGAEAKLASKNLSLLAENIHHELKTPLVVIVNKLDTIKTAMEENEACKACKRCEVQKTDWIIEDINLVETHIDVIYNLLDRMKNFKNMKRTTENKSVYEVITVAFQTLELFSKTKFKVTIDPGLRSYMVADKITNEDILNVFINHIKNSLEANATKLEVIMHKYHKNIIYLQLIDNGDGIPEYAVDKVFVPNFSTKGINSSEDDETRGIGLYLSKTTLQTCGGDDFLIETSHNGTSFGINIPALRR